MSKLTKIFSAVLGVKEKDVNSKLSPKNTTSWDSLNAIILITEIENAFGVKFSFDEAMAVKDFGGVLSLVKSKKCDPYA